MKMPNLGADSGIFNMIIQAIESFVKDVEEILQKLIDKIKEGFT